MSDAPKYERVCAWELDANIKLKHCSWYGPRVVVVLERESVEHLMKMRSELSTFSTLAKTAE